MYGISSYSPRRTNDDLIGSGRNRIDGKPNFAETERFEPDSIGNVCHKSISNVSVHSQVVVRCKLGLREKRKLVLSLA